MVEIACPNCAAKYQVPDSALGSSGRKVTCSACAHVWMALPPDAPGQQAPASGERGRQMAEIRQMLNEVQSAENARAAQPPPPGPSPMREPPERSGAVPPAPEPGPSQSRADEEQDFLRQRMSVSGQSGRMATIRDEAEGAPRYDRERMLGTHTKRQRRRELAEHQGSGAFRTGFLLVVLVAGLLVGLYVLQPQLSDKMPGAAPALAEYVDAVDSMRLSLAEQFEQLRAKIDSVAGEEEG